ncbi:MAG: peptidylprolyl isomerase [Planctomycetes bacterium]|nr:peptidylprolyl isomerase [Planctomycetota bacterium]
MHSSPFSAMTFGAVATALTATAWFAIPQNPAPAAAAPPAAVTATVDAGKGILVAGQPNIVKLTFTNNTQTRRGLDPACVSGLGLFITPAGESAKQVVDESAFGKEPPYQIPPGGSITASVDVSSQVAMYAGKIDSASLVYTSKDIAGTPTPVELVEDLTKTIIVFKTSLGVMKFKVDPVNAPLGSRNFVRHVKNGYYTGTKFHRIITGFMAQGGDPYTKEADATKYGQGGAPFNNKPLPAEITEVKHVRGTLSYARNGDPLFNQQNPQIGQMQQGAIQLLGMLFMKMNPDQKVAQARIEQLVKDGFLKDRKPFLDSAGSQFFICFKEVPNLDGGYTAFGKMVEGDDVLKTIEGTAGGDAAGTPSKEIRIEAATLEVAK